MIPSSDSETNRTSNNEIQYFLYANWTTSSIFYQITVSVKHTAICAYVTARTIYSNVLCKYATLHL
jgi:hypothetical protein